MNACPATIPTASINSERKPWSAEVIEIDIDGRTFWVRPVGSWVLQSNNVVAEAMAISLDKPLEWAVGFFFGNVELSMELWTVIAGISGFDD